jgi:hypothetical protein
METEALQVGTLFGFPVHIIIPTNFTTEERQQIVEFYAQETKKPSAEVDYLLAPPRVSIQRHISLVPAPSRFDC